MIQFFRTFIAKRRLSRMVEQRAKSFEIEQYRRKREASKKGWAHRRSADRAGGLRPEPAAQSQPKALIPCAGDA